MIGVLPVFRNVTVTARISPWKSLLGSALKSTSTRGVGACTSATSGIRFRTEGLPGRAGVGVVQRSARDSDTGKRPLKRYEIERTTSLPSVVARIGM